MTRIPALIICATLAITVAGPRAANAQRSAAPLPPPPVAPRDPSPATAGDSAAGRTMQIACLRDYRARCSGRDMSPGIAAGCLSQYYINLSGECRAALDTYNGRAGDETE